MFVILVHDIPQREGEAAVWVASVEALLEHLHLLLDDLLAHLTLRIMVDYREHHIDLRIEWLPLKHAMVRDNLALRRPLQQARIVMNLCRIVVVLEVMSTQAADDDDDDRNALITAYYYHYAYCNFNFEKLPTTPLSKEEEASVHASP